MSISIYTILTLNLERCNYRIKIYLITKKQISPIYVVENCSQYLSRQAPLISVILAILTIS